MNQKIKIIFIPNYRTDIQEQRRSENTNLVSILLSKHTQIIKSITSVKNTAATARTAAHMTKRLLASA